MTSPLVHGVGSTVGGRYRLVRALGSGSMGTVFEGEDATTRARVAVKVLHTGKTSRDAAERRARFLREASLCAALRHPSIMEVLDHGIDASTDEPFLVMPLLAGEDLGHVLERTGALDPTVAVALFVRACDGLGAAHMAGIVHRDIKPSNLFLEDAADGTVRVRLADFGLAKAEGLEGAGATLTTSGAFLGTAQYVSPEQATNAKHADARSDVWSLAMTLYHALAGRPAFAQTGSFLALVLELTGRGVPPLQDAAPWIAPAIARAVHGALIKDPALRCPSAGELALALEMAVGFDAARAPIGKAAVRPIAAELRAAIAARAPLPASWDDLLRS